MQPLSQVSERGEGELYKGVYTFQSAKRGSPTPGLEYIYSPFPLLAVMGKTRTSRTVRDALADCPRLNSNSKNAKSTAGRTGCWAGRTVHLDPADLPRAGRRPVLKRITDRPQEARGLSIWKRIFLENFCQKPQILNKYQKPADRPPREPGLSAQHLKTDFS
jgi:hypothetical protein